MTTLKKINFLLLFTVLLFSACKKDQITDEEQIITPVPTIMVNGSVSGIIVDDLHQPVSDATVRVGANIVMSDENGVFIFKDITMDKAGALLTAEKEGYFYNAKFVRPVLNKMSFTKFKLKEKILTGTFESGSGGTLIINDVAGTPGEKPSIAFPANGIKTESGGAYTGAVNVYATWIDPTGVDVLLEMPGDLRGRNLSEAQVQLTSFGMIGVELEGDGVEILNLADGQTATIVMPIPNALLGTAPATIPLWYFDEAKGYWVEEGEATLQNGKYVGTVKHFSFWNCDVPEEVIDLSGTVTSEGGGVGGLLVEIRLASNGTNGYGYTNEDGFFSGFVPKNEELTIHVFDDCGLEIYTAAIGAFSVDTQLDNIAVNPTYDFVTFSGTLNCDGASVSNGYIKIDFGNNQAYIIVEADGSFSALVSTCNATSANVIGYDLTEIRSSNESTHNISGLTEIMLGDINVCEVASLGFFTVNINGHSHTYTNVFYDNSSGVNLIGDTLDPENFFYFGLINTTLNIDVDLWGMEFRFKDGNTVYYATCSSCFIYDVDCFLSSFSSSPGELISGNFNGVVDDASGTTIVNIDGHFNFIVQ